MSLVRILRYSDTLTKVQAPVVTVYRNTSVHTGPPLNDNAKLKWKGNVILMGCPGSGKTTVGAILSQTLGKIQLDIDNDYLEQIWETTVEQKLKNLGDEAFLEAEGEALLKLDVSNTIVSLTGSNPLHEAAMSRIRDTGSVIYLDVPIPGILKRLHEMKTARIVGVKNGVTMEDVLRYRIQFYEKYYDIRVLVGKQDSCETIAGKVKEKVSNFNNKKPYVSTRGVAKAAQPEHQDDRNFTEATLQGFAPDGGLFVPNFIPPKPSLGELERLVNMTYSDRAIRILEQWIGTQDIDPRSLKSMVTSAYNSEHFGSDEVCPVRPLHNNQYITELFHGPTASFKDLALQLMPQFFKRAACLQTNDNKQKHLILVATSGDTGAAVADGFSRHAGDGNIGVMVLYPEIGVSEIQKAQMKSMNGPRTHVIGVDGNFDFCQSTIKHIFSDPALRQDFSNNFKCSLSAANSINWARLLPQVVYHCSAYLDLVSQKVIQLGESVDYCIPTGNFGNILAAYYAKTMGIPFGRLISASNVNNVVSEFLQTGRYDLTSRRLNLTNTPAIDILKSSNLERYLWRVFNNRGDQIQELYSSLETRGFFEVSEEIRRKIQCDFVGDWCSEEDCLSTIKSTYNDTNYILDPHTAVAKAVASRLQDRNRPMLIASTAHYGKFADVVLKALDMDQVNAKPLEMTNVLNNLHPNPPMHQRLVDSLKSTPTGNHSCEASRDTIVSKIKQFLSTF